MDELPPEAGEPDVSPLAPWLSAEETEGFRRELEASGLPAWIERARAEFERIVSGTTARGQPYGFGALERSEADRLYAVVRKLRPGVLVETGVCNGVSTAILLLALDRNGDGLLHSIDLPEYTDTPYPEGTFWEGKGGATIPRGREPGWVVPERLRGRWRLTTGRSQEALPPLLDRLGTIDLFLHDSEHSYECMTFEYRTAYPHLRPGGLLVSDDVRWNTAFRDFARARNRSVHVLGENLALLMR